MENYLEDFDQISRISSKKEISDPKETIQNIENNMNNP